MVADGSRCEPELSGIAVTPVGDVLTVDRANRCVKLFAQRPGGGGGVPCKIHGSEALWDAAVASDGNFIVTDK